MHQTYRTKASPATKTDSHHQKYPTSGHIAPGRKPSYPSVAGANFKVQRGPLTTIHGHLRSVVQLQGHLRGVKLTPVYL